MSVLKDRLLDERESAILRALVYDYIMTGKPVGSRSFVQKYQFSISPATMRNIMADLEQIGYLQQPHSSSGRIPTDKGYRYYVDSLLEKYRSFNEDVSIKEDILSREMQFEKLFDSITKMLSNESRYAGVMLTPAPYFAVMKRIELIPLDPKDVLVIMVERTGMVFTRKVKISDTLTYDSLHEFSRYLNSELCGYPLQEIKERVIKELRSGQKPGGNNLALDIAELSIVGESNSMLHIDGIENLLKIPEMIEKDHLDSLLHIIEEKNILKDILELAMRFDGIQTMIGNEIESSYVKGCSIVTSSYKIGNKNVGVIGVLGPTRMDYEKVVPLVDYTGKIVSDLLTKMSK
ncbi:MAG: heat-inducible transcriptional repressor HrcA [Leptospirales bacterium]|nr:heat-inducible transcriptional repressor HrcA [Leptospirales bacterium]